MGCLFNRCCCRCNSHSTGKETVDLGNGIEGEFRLDPNHRTQIIIRKCTMDIANVWVNCLTEPIKTYVVEILIKRGDWYDPERKIT